MFKKRREKVRKYFHILKHKNSNCWNSKSGCWVPMTKNPIQVKNMEINIIRKSFILMIMKQIDIYIFSSYKKDHQLTDTMTCANFTWVVDWQHTWPRLLLLFNYIKSQQELWFAQYHSNCRAAVVTRFSHPDCVWEKRAEILNLVHHFLLWSKF